MEQKAAEKITALVHKKYIQILGLCMLGMVFYLFSGREWIYLIDDSYTYMDAKAHFYGVKPIYPLFLFAVRFIFGENLYLGAVVVIQSVIAVICTLLFTLCLQRIFRLNFAEMILLYAFTMMPFAIDLPEACVSHMILTEGLAYPLFYIYFIFVLQYIFYKKKRWLLLTAAMAFLMGLIRSQLIILLIFTTLVFVCVEFAGKEYSMKIMRWIMAGVNLIIGLIGSYMLVLCIYQFCAGYENYLVPAINRWDNRQNAAENEGGQEEIDKAENISTAESEEITYQETMSQMTHLIMIRGFFEADEEDVVLFDTPEMQDIFRRVYEEADKREYRYKYAQPGLYMWRDLVNDRIVGAAKEAINNYLSDNPDVQINQSEVMRELGMKVLLKHFDRYLYHSIRLMIVGFISSVFFQIEKIYLLCHLITLCLFLISIGGMIYCIKYKGEKNVVVFAGSTVGFICMLVGIITLVFVPSQRYMVYAMGIFYCSMYLLLKEILLITAKRFQLSKNGDYYG